MPRYEDVRRLDVTVDDALLVGVPDGVTDLHEQVETLAHAQPVLVAISVSRMPRTSSMTK